MLLIPPGVKSPEGDQPLLGPGERYVQLIVASDGDEDPGNRLGRLRVATDGADEYNLREKVRRGPGWMVGEGFESGGTAARGEHTE